MSRDPGHHLREIDENLIRLDIPLIDHADRLERRQQIVKALNPGPDPRGGDHKSAEFKDKIKTANLATLIPKDTAEKTGMSERAIRRREGCAAPYTTPHLAGFSGDGAYPTPPALSHLGAHPREGHSTYAGGFAAVQEFIERGLRPDAIFAVNDIMAMGVIDALRRAGLRIPEDVSVTGFDDIQAASWPNYDLTTVAQPVAAMIERTLDLLLEQIEDPSRAGEDISIHGELRRRGSARLSGRTASLS